VGFSLEASAVRQAGPHDPPPPRGHPLSDPARALERPARGLNSKVRLISHRSFGFHGAPPLIALVYLCCGGLVVTPPLA